MLPRLCALVGGLLLPYEAGAAAAAAAAAAAGGVEHLEPGGWGACLSMARHPVDSKLWVGSFDVGGLAFSRDDATTWSVDCNLQIATLQVFTALFAGADHNTLILGTSRGVYIGEHDDRGSGGTAAANGSSAATGVAV